VVVQADCNADNVDAPFKQHLLLRFLLKIIQIDGISAGATVVSSSLTGDDQSLLVSFIRVHLKLSIILCILNDLAKTVTFLPSLLPQ